MRWDFIWNRIFVGALALAALQVAALPAARAEIGSDKSAAIVIFPKLLVDTSTGLDTLIRMANTSDRNILMQCFYVNATPKCSIPSGSCFPDPSSCQNLLGGVCKPLWQETDFFVRLTARQPTSWLVSQGAAGCSDVQLQGRGQCSNNPAVACQRDSECGGGLVRCILPPCFPFDGGRANPGGNPNETNQDSLVPPSAEDPFIGELKCIALDDSRVPVARNDIKGEALIGVRNEASGFIDLAGYNAIGIPAIEGQGNRDNVLRIGGAGDPTNPGDPCHQNDTCPEYQGCPNFLILDHAFDGAVDPLVPNTCQDDVCSISQTPCNVNNDCLNRCDGGTCVVTGETCLVDANCDQLTGKVRIATDLTLIPCTQDLNNQNPDLSKTTAQFLVFNEFEQRLSTSIPVNCFQESRLSNIDTHQNDRSIWSAGVQGTLTGQTRIRGVVPREVETGSVEAQTGYTLLGVAEEFRCRGPEFPTCSFINATDLVSSTAANVHFQGRRPLSDFLFIP